MFGKFHVPCMLKTTFKSLFIGLGVCKPCKTNFYLWLSKHPLLTTGVTSGTGTANPLMTKRKRTKGQTSIYNKLHRKLNIEQHEPRWKPRWTQELLEGKQFLLRMKHLPCYSCYNPSISHKWGKVWIVIMAHCIKP